MRRASRSSAIRSTTRSTRRTCAAGSTSRCASTRRRERPRSTRSSPASSRGVAATTSTRTSGCSSRSRCGPAAGDCSPPTRWAHAGWGQTPRRSVANPWGELHDTPGVWIGDASAFPTTSGVNPMVTIMALAHRTAQAIADRRRRAQRNSGARLGRQAPPSRGAPSGAPRLLSRRYGGCAARWR